jgi:hypothetical protein
MRDWDDQFPDLLVFNTDKSVFIISSKSNSLMIDIKSQTQIDIDDEFKLNEFKQLIYDNGHFYLIANKRLDKLGFYLLKICAMEPFGPNNNKNTPQDKERMFMINWENKLDIGDVNIEVREDRNWNEFLKREVVKRELVVGYKSIYINVYSVFVIDI